MTVADNNVLQSAPPKSALVVKGTVARSRQQVQAVKGNFNASYLTGDSISDQMLELDADETFKSSPYQKFSVLNLTTSAPIEVKLVLDNEEVTEIEVQVQKFLHIDFGIKRFEIKAVGQTTTRVYINSIGTNE